MKKKVIVIDDDDGIREAFHAVLDSAGYDVQIESTPECLKTLQPGSLPDLLLLDILLSGADGRDICRKLKTQKETKSLPVVLISAHPNAEKSAKEAAADDFMAKPFDIEELLQVVKKHTQ